MLRRNLNSDFVGGAYVFPGGAVDDADRHSDLEAVCEGRTDAQASEALGIERGGLAFWVAAIRECFEEAGVLLAHAGDGRVISFADPEVAERFRLHRKAVDSGEQRLIEVCQAEELHIAADQIHYFSHWITPKARPAATTPASSWPPHRPSRCRCTTTARRSPTCGCARPTRSTATRGASSS